MQGLATSWVEADVIDAPLPAGDCAFRCRSGGRLGGGGWRGAPPGRVAPRGRAAPLLTLGQLRSRKCLLKLGSSTDLIT